MIEKLKVSDAMTRVLYAVAPDTSLVTAARLFALHHITGAPVIDEEGRAVGVITQSDLVDPERPRTGRFGRRVYYRVSDGRAAEIADDGPISDGIVLHAMSPYVLSVTPEAPLLDAIRLMAAENVHRLMVLREKRLVGIVTSMDVLRVLAGSATRAEVKTG